MTTIRAGIVYSATTIHIRENLKIAAKDAGVNFTRTMTEALESKLKEIGKYPEDFE